MTQPAPAAARPRGWYRLTLVLALAGVFAAQKFIEVRPVFRVGGAEVANAGGVKAALGGAVSVLLVLVLAEFAFAFLPRLFDRRPAPPAARRDGPTLAALLLAGGFLFLNLYSRPLAGYLPCVESAVHLWAAGGAAAGWVALAVLLWRNDDPRAVTVGFAALVVVTRVNAYWHLPVASVGGDMLAAIDRGQELLLAGRFPYTDDPPPAMPYWPGTFLLYTVPKLLGLDPRVMNLLAEVLTVLAVGGWRQADARPSIARVALPLLLLLPNWTYYSAETQYPVSVLLAVLVARSVGWRQAVALGLAVAANQTFAALGVFLLPFWVRRFGWRRAASYTGLSLLACLVLVGPFLIWDAREFVRVTLLSLQPFDADTLAGRFSLRPLVDGLFPHAATAFMGLTVLGTVGLNARRTTTPAAVAALGYCVLLLLLHRTFTHYFLPVVAVVLAVPSRRSATPPASA